MSRSPLAYPLNRAADSDAGGAADLQTDIMRFMAILALCLVAIFALVQSIPLQPAAATTVTAVTAPQPATPIAQITTGAAEPPAPPAPVQPSRMPPIETVALTRPKWISKYPVSAAHPPQETTDVEPAPNPETAPTASRPEAPQAQPASPAPQGFTLRFESDLALTRLVAAQKVGLYAIDQDRAQRMSVRDSRISFWDASRPNQFHEMEPATVPGPVIDALARTGVKTAGVSWGVTLPGKLRQQLNTLLREHSGGALVIGSDGNLSLEAS